MSAFKRYRDVGIVIILLAVPFFFLRANMKAPENLNALDRVLLRISDARSSTRPRASRAASRTSGRLRLSRRREGRQRAARVRQRAPARECPPARAEPRRREPGSRSALAAPRDDRRGDRQRAGHRQGLQRVLPRDAGRARSRLAQHAPAHAGRLARRRGRRRRCTSTGDAVDVQLAVDAAFGIDVEDERTKARGFVRGTSDASRHPCKVEDDRLARRGRDRRSARHERQGRVVPEGPPGRARHQGRQARARPHAGGRGRADRGLLPPRRRPHHRHAPSRGRRPGPEGESTATAKEARDSG